MEVLLPIFCRPMSIAQIKNLRPRLEHLEQDASGTLTRLRGHDLWLTLGFDTLDRLDDPLRRAQADSTY